MRINHRAGSGNFPGSFRRGDDRRLPAVPDTLAEFGQASGNPATAGRALPIPPGYSHADNAGMIRPLPGGSAANTGFFIRESAADQQPTASKTPASPTISSPSACEDKNTRMLALAFS